MKKFRIRDNIGNCKYTVSTYDGVDTHKDGSPFWGIAIFKNKKKRDAFIKQLKQQGYVEDCFNFL